MELFRKEVGQILKKHGIKGRLEKPPEGIGADLALPCFELAGKLRKNPALIAEDLARNLEPSGVIERVENAGPYLNFYADWGKLGDFVLMEIIRKREKYGSGEEGGHILIEHTSANPDGPLHLGHFRNSVIGDSLARLLKFQGNRVSTISWINDTGRQIAIAVMEHLKVGKGSPANHQEHMTTTQEAQDCLHKLHKQSYAPLQTACYNSGLVHPVKKAPSLAARRRDKGDWAVLDLYLSGNRRIEKDESLGEEVSNIINRFEAGDKGLRRAFYSLTEECIKGHKETLSNLDIRIDEFFRESKSLFDGSVRGVLEKVRKLKWGREEGKRIWVDLKRFGIEREFTLTREEGTTIYPARDLAFHQYKFSKAPYNISILGTDHKFYFEQLVSTLGLLFPRQTGDYRLVFYEFLLLPEGTMSTRAGKFVSVDEVMERALKLAREAAKEISGKEKDRVAKAVSSGAMKYAMLKVSPEKTYSFSVEDALSFEGDNAPYIQYTHARCCSIMRKGRVRKIGKFQAKNLREDREREILKGLAEFPEIAEKSAKDLRPHYICTYLYELSDLFNNFYQSLPVLKAGKGVREARLALVLGVKTVLGIGLNLLGIEALKKM